MSIAIAPVSLSGLSTGQGGSIDLSNIMGGGGVNVTPGGSLPTIRLHNDSGCGLAITLPKSAQSFNLPAGGWQDCRPSPGENAIQYTVVYTLPNPPVSLLMATYYAPGEAVPPMTQLGNSPIGGGVQTTQATSVTNTGFPPATPFIFAEPIGDGSANGAVNINNQGQMTLGDATYNGSIALLGVAGSQISEYVTNLVAVLRLINANGNVEIDLETSQKTLVGGVSGSAFLYEPFQGLFKIIIIELANFKTGASNQQITLPANFGFRALILATDSEPFELLSGGVAQSVRQWTSFAAAGAGGGTTATTAMQGFNLFWLATAFDTIQFNSGWASARSGVILIVGQ